MEPVPSGKSKGIALGELNIVVAKSNCRIIANKEFSKTNFTEEAQDEFLAWLIDKQKIAM